MQQKSDSHCSRANLDDPPSFLAPFTYESLFCCTLFPKGKTKKLEVQGSQDLPSRQNDSGNHCNKRVIHTVLEPSIGIFLPFPHHLRLNHCFVALYFQKENPRSKKSNGPKTSHPLQIESENRCNKRVIHTVLEPTLMILQAFSHHLRMNHCFVALYFQKEKPRS
jgi:hypothetical protein